VLLALEEIHFELARRDVLIGLSSEDGAPFYALFGLIEGSGFTEFCVISAFEVHGALVGLAASAESAGRCNVEVMGEGRARTVRYVFLFFPNRRSTLFHKIEHPVIIYMLDAVFRDAE